jgi:Family of unknown function (DUF6088)
MTLPEFILCHARSLPEGGILSPREFLHVGSRSAVDQALSRLAKDGLLLRIGRGTYVAPVVDCDGVRAPAAMQVVESLASSSGEVVVPHGSAAAKTLGLTQQAASGNIYITSGRTRSFRLGQIDIVLKHAPAWLLALGKSPAGNAVRALAWLGPAQVHDALSKLRYSLPRQEWIALASSRATLPVWMARAIGDPRLMLLALFATSRVALSHREVDRPLNRSQANDFRLQRLQDRATQRPGADNASRQLTPKPRRHDHLQIY